MSKPNSEPIRGKKIEPQTMQEIADAMAENAAAGKPFNPMDYVSLETRKFLEAKEEEFYGRITATMNELTRRMQMLKLGEMLSIEKAIEALGKMETGKERTGPGADLKQALDRILETDRAKKAHR